MPDLEPSGSMHVVLCRYAVHYDEQYVDDWRPPPDPYSEFGDDLGWGDESFFEAPHEREKGFVRLDAHILTTPAVGDIDGDGHLEVVVAASYYFDPDYYADEVHLDRSWVHAQCLTPA